MFFLVKILLSFPKLFFFFFLYLHFSNCKFLTLCSIDWFRFPNPLAIGPFWIPRCHDFWDKSLGWFLGFQFNLSKTFYTILPLSPQPFTQVLFLVKSCLYLVNFPFATQIQHSLPLKRKCSFYTLFPRFNTFIYSGQKIWLKSQVTKKIGPWNWSFLVALNTIA